MIHISVYFTYIHLLIYQKSNSKSFCDEIISILANLRNILKTNLQQGQFSEEMKRTNTILLKLCLILYMKTAFQICINSLDNGHDKFEDQAIQKELMGAIQKILQSDCAHIDPKDEHLFETLQDFIYFRKTLFENGSDIYKILVYVIICFCLLSQMNVLVICTISNLFMGFRSAEVTNVFRSITTAPKNTAKREMLYGPLLLYYTRRSISGNFE